MYSIFWYNGGLKSVVGNIESIIQLAHLLESNKTQFKVSNCSCYLSQKQFNFSGYKYWLYPSDKFNDQD